MGKYQNFAFSAFTFESETGTLLRNGRRLRIPHQSAKLLEFLLSQAGNLVTREELQQALWPDGEFLEYEQGINKAINRLREILRDDPRQPRFLETIPKRGYRFIANVTLSAESDLKAAPATHTPGEVVIASGTSILPPLSKDITEPQEPPSPIHPIRWERFVRIHPGLPGVRIARPLRNYVSAALGIVVVAAATVAIFANRTSHDNGVQIGIMPFQAVSPEGAALAESFRLHVVGALSQLPGVQVRSPHAMVNAMSNSDIQALAKDTDRDMLLMGSLVQSGEQYLLQLELVRAADANHLASFQYSGSRDELASIGNRIQRDFFGYLKSGSETAEVVNGSTQDRAAYRYYLQAKNHSNEPSLDSATRAIESYKAALAIDQNFALAYAGWLTPTSHWKLKSRQCG